MFANPKENLEKFGLSEGSVVADLGSGIGHYALEAAKMVGDGKVYAVEVQKDLLDKLKNEAIHEHLTNVEVIWGNIEKVGGTKIRDASCDVVIASNVFFQVEDREGFAKEVARIIKPTGRFLFIDWSDNFGGIGPSAQSIVKPATAKAFFEKQGFVIDREMPAGSHHYALVIRKKTL